MVRDVLTAFIREHGIDPFDDQNSKLDLSRYVTRDAKRIARKAYRSLRFLLPGTKRLLEALALLEGRFSYVASLEHRDRCFLSSLSPPVGSMRTPFTYTIATVSEEVYRDALARSEPCVFVTGVQDLASLNDYELVLHDLDHDVPNGVEGDPFVFSHLRSLARYRALLDVPVPAARELAALLPLLDAKPLTPSDIESAFADLEARFAERLDELTLSGSSLIKAMSGDLPAEVDSILTDLVSGTILDGLVARALPLSLDDEAVERRIATDQQRAAVAFAERAMASGVSEVPMLIERFKEELLLLDFEQALFEASGDVTPTSGSLRFSGIRNPMLQEPQPISFELESARASILTGANSGGKTTLLELLITMHVYTDLGIGFSGPCALPGFERVAYFAKNSGSANRGAFETLLDQLARIDADEHTLILADEIEAVTEPGVAGVIIAESVAYFLEQGSSLVIATHLGREIEPVLPEGARIDGIEAKGLTADLELEVDHEPVIGRLARSTPELIVRRLAQTKGGAYYERLDRAVRNP